MADIRQTIGVKDDFNRANENPILGPVTQAEWGTSDAGTWGRGAVRGNVYTVPAGGSTNVNAYWTPETYDGDAAEVWAYAGGGGVLSGLSYRLALWAAIGSGVSGYYCRNQYVTGTDVTELWRVTGGIGNLTSIDSRADGYKFEGRYCLLRRNGSDVEVWATIDQDSPGSVDTTAWELVLNGTDTTYETGLRLAIGINDNSGNGEGTWDYFGGGPAVGFRPQFYRRTQRARIARV